MSTRTIRFPDPTHTAFEASVIDVTAPTSVIVANVEAAFVDRTTRVIVVVDAAHTESVDNAKSTTGPDSVAAVIHALFDSTNNTVVFVDEL
jgi:hypothetical protein